MTTPASNTRVSVITANKKNEAYICEIDRDGTGRCIPAREMPIPDYSKTARQPKIYG